MNSIQVRPPVDRVRMPAGRVTRLQPLRAALVALIALVVATVLALVGLAAPAQAAAAPGYALNYVQMPDGRNLPVRWNGCQNITYKVNLAAVAVASRTAILNETHAALRALASRTGFTFTYRGQTAEVPQTSTVDNQSAELIIAFTTPARTNLSLAGTTMGQGGFRYRWWSRSSGGKVTYTLAATRGYVVIDTPDMLRYTRSGSGAGATRSNLIHHEIGHVFGLQHVANNAAVMNPLISSRTPSGYSYSGDTTGLARVGRSAGCIDMTGSGVTDLR